MQRGGAGPAAGGGSARAGRRAGPRRIGTEQVESTTRNETTRNETRHPGHTHLDHSSEALLTQRASGVHFMRTGSLDNCTNFAKVSFSAGFPARMLGLRGPVGIQARLFL